MPAYADDGAKSAQVIAAASAVIDRYFHKLAAGGTTGRMVR